MIDIESIHDIYAFDKFFLHDILYSNGRNVMMKKLILIALVLLSLAVLATPAFCGGATTKLGRGLANMVTSPMEVINQITRTNETDGGIAAATVGVLKGAGWTLGRAVVGVYETVTFMLPWPDDYGPILRDPEYFWENTPM
jgi:putative exosortase-associated protein (TIGR04073 family)